MIISLFAIFVLFAGIFLFEVPALIKQKYWRELAAFLFFWGLSLTLAVLLTFNIPVPNPQKMINTSVEYIFKLIKHNL